MALAKHTKKGLQDLLKSLTILPCAKPFMKPIDPVALEIEDYFEVVTKPIDLGTIRKKLISDGYSDPYELFSDFDLLIENVRVYFTDLDDPMRGSIPVGPAGIVTSTGATLPGRASAGMRAASITSRTSVMLSLQKIKPTFSLQRSLRT
mmetsp:Transcript_19173/g.35016  ORF Transcript_19173/g.35016 Transcript_19173/m.35016 type:complete len:149 (-) Transcript_19173:624-1070(-)